jgi:hypothetical protein
MGQNLIIVLAIILAILAVIYYYNGNLCPLCEKCKSDGKCSTCSGVFPLSSPDAQQILQQLIRSCTYRLRGVMRESEASATDVQAFVDGGSNRLIIVTNIIPENFVKVAQTNSSTLKAVALSSTLTNGAKKYMVMSVNNGHLGPMGSPTTTFSDAFNYLQTSVKLIGSDINNLVFYIDEDLACLEEATPIGEETTSIEACCGRVY